MNPEPKPDRMKMRLIVRGDTESARLYANQATDSPTPMASSLKMLIALDDEDPDVQEELAIGDVNTAFLKGEKYGPDNPPRYVAYKAHRRAQLRVFRLTGSVYGQTETLP